MAWKHQPISVSPSSRHFIAHFMTWSLKNLVIVPVNFASPSLLLLEIINMPLFPCLASKVVATILFTITYWQFGWPKAYLLAFIVQCTPMETCQGPQWFWTTYLQSWTSQQWCNINHHQAGQCLFRYQCSATGCCHPANNTQTTLMAQWSGANWPSKGSQLWPWYLLHNYQVLSWVLCNSMYPKCSAHPRNTGQVEL